MAPEIKTTNSSLKLNFHAQPSLQDQRVTFEIEENFNPSLLMASPELGEIFDEDEAEVNGGWDADEDITEVLKQQRINDRKKRAEQKNNKLQSSF